MFAGIWTREVDRIALAVSVGGMRTVAVTSPTQRSGVSSLARELAAAISLAGSPTLLVDLSASPVASDEGIIWRPGIGGAGQAIVRSGRGFDELCARFSSSTRYLFNNVESLRHTFAEELAHYRAVIVDLPALQEGGTLQISAAAAAAACDGTVIVCVSGRLRRQELVSGTETLRLAGAKLAGVVVNNVECPPLGAELAREARRLQRVTPRLSAWMQRKALTSNFLN